MPPKTEPSVIGNVPESRSALSIKSIVKDFQKSLKNLQDLDKSLTTKKELDALKAKMKMLEEENASLKVDLKSKQKINEKLEGENAKIKADFEAAERDRMVYYNQYHQNGKEVLELQTEIRRLKDQNQALMDEKNFLKEENEFLKQSAIDQIVNDQAGQFSEASSSSIASAVPVNDSESDVDEVIPNKDDLAVGEVIENDLDDQPNAKKPRLDLNVDTENPWKCMVCKVVRFKSIEEVRQHTKTFHPDHKHFCDKCPYTTYHLNNFRGHQKQHNINETKNKGNAFLCSFCDIILGSKRSLTRHNENFH